MRTYSIQKGKDSPGIFIDESNNIIEISGNSTFKEVDWFYANVLKWIVALNNDSLGKKTINLKLKKIDDGSSRRLTILIHRLIHQYPTLEYEINWYSKGNDLIAKDLCRKMLNNPEMIVNVI
jgi:hypothetical protein